MSSPNLPLYCDMDSSLSKPPKGANIGLWFQRYYNQYDGNWQVGDEAKAKFLKQIVDDKNLDEIGKQKKALEAAVAKQCLLAQANQGGFNCYQADWHWVTGLGYNHPVENGLIWHHTLSTPYLPASSVKGLVRAWMEKQDVPDREKIYQWFGSEHKDTNKSDLDNQSGQLMFFDALPVEPVELHRDVMTPHTGKWLMEGNNKGEVPADWHDPNPIFFLSCKQTVLNFSLAKMPFADATLDLTEVWGALTNALEYLGVGAKTGTGYGYFSDSENAQKEKTTLQEVIDKQDAEKAKLSMTPEQLKVTEFRERVDKSQSQRNQGLGSVLAQDMKSLITEATSWSDENKALLFKEIKIACTLLKIDLKKNKKAKKLVQPIKPPQ